MIGNKWKYANSAGKALSQAALVTRQYGLRVPQFFVSITSPVIGMGVGAYIALKYGLPAARINE